MRAIDVHVHPMNQAYYQAGMTLMPAAERMFKGKSTGHATAAVA